jgi:hypothetical protein
VFILEGYNISYLPTMKTAHITKRCFPFAKICEMRGLERRDFPEKPGHDWHKSCQAFGNNRVVRQSACG